MRRTLHIPEAVAAAAAGLERHARRTDEFLEGARWILERDAEWGRRLTQDPPLYALDMEAEAGHPSMTLFYTIDYDTVVLLSISPENRPAILAPAPPGIGPGDARY
jgi:hypothetical protein